MLTQIRKLIGFPTNKSLKYGYNILIQSRLLIIIYLILLIIYFTRIHPLNAFANPDFQISFAASLLEDLVVFIFLTIGVTLISIKLSSINPEDYDYDRRIKALMNSENVRDDNRAFIYLNEQISKMLTYNKVMHYEVAIVDYHPESRIYSIVTTRTHVVTNMCKDKSFENQSFPLVIETDIEVSGIYGRLNFVNLIDPKDWQKTVREVYSLKSPNTKLQKGENVFIIPDINLEKDSEIAFVVSYTCNHKVEDINDPKKWLYSEALKYTSNVTFSLINNLESEKEVKLDFRSRNRSGALGDIITGQIVGKGAPNRFEKIIDHSLMPSERLEFYLH